MSTTTKIQKIRKAVRTVFKKLKSKRRTRSEKTKTEFTMPLSPSNLLVMKTPERASKWREQIEDACFMVDNIRFTKNDDIVKQSTVYRKELNDMRSKICMLQMERQMLSRALIPLKPNESLIYPANDSSFIGYEQASKLDLTPPPPMSPLITARRDEAMSTDMCQMAAIHTFLHFNQVKTMKMRIETKHVAVIQVYFAGNVYKVFKSVATIATRTVKLVRFQ